jgi:phage regulator Rha-like protein
VWTKDFIITNYDDEKTAKEQDRKVYPFTKHGVTMLASALKSATARKMNIAIVRAFIALRKFATQ